MTGFGSGDAVTPAGRLVVELRAVNHRFLDVRTRVSRELADLAGLVEQLVRERLSRGRIDVTVRLEATSGQPVFLDTARARVAFSALRTLCDELSPGEPVPLSLLASVPELFSPASEHAREALREACRVAFEMAAQRLEQMRAEEGSALASDLRARLRSVQQTADAVNVLVPAVVEQHHRKLRARVQRLIGGDSALDNGRLEQEIALLADRTDVTEELTRLASHCSQFESMLDQSEACGRRLDFLVQEMAREINTIGSKAQDADIAHHVVDAKTELERIREQVQNIE